MQRRLTVNQLQSDFAIKLVNLRAAVRARRLASLALRTRSAFFKPTLTIETSAGRPGTGPDSSRSSR